MAQKRNLTQYEKLNCQTANFICSLIIVAHHLKSELIKTKKDFLAADWLVQISTPFSNCALDVVGTPHKSLEIHHSSAQSKIARMTFNGSTLVAIYPGEYLMIATVPLAKYLQSTSVTIGALVKDIQRKIAFLHVR